MTFSIVAHSADEQMWGVAVASKFLAAAAVVNWARAGAGGIATQAFARVSFGPNGLDLLATGLSAEETLAKLLSTDKDAEHRQVGIVDQRGGAAAHTGSECFDYAGHYVGEGFTCQGNILAGRGVIEAMTHAYIASSGSLPDRLYAALLAGDRAGGDKRGRQSAGILVVKAGGGYGGDNDRFFDLRVDDHTDPVPRLRELMDLRTLYFDKTPPENHLPIDAALATELQTILAAQGHYTGALHGQWDEPSREAFWAFVGVENLEERWTPDDHPERLDPVVLNFIRTRFRA
ncbi:MAG TPA: DUF1028 domain-containing protein [Aggregatilineales bacterium]|nr:DUF1028 domain-containing protein [Anaerolineales bacterium]HRE48077.1 DUF1028 domain-containing protein [Aggregatilineales bacterium]